MNLRAALGAAVIAAAVLTAALAAYRNGKLEALEPKHLAGSPEWDGPRGAPCTLLMLGDSTVARWPAPKIAGWRTARLGFPGAGAVNIGARIKGALAATRPDAVLIAAGTNDASAAALQWGGSVRTVAAAASAIDDAIRAAAAAGARQIIVIPPAPPHDPPPWRWLVYGSRQAEAAAMLARAIAMTAQARGALVLDAGAIGEDLPERERGALHADAVHLSPAGYRHLDKNLSALLRGACAGQPRLSARAPAPWPGVPPRPLRPLPDSVRR